MAILEILVFWPQFHSTVLFFVKHMLVYSFSCGIYKSLQFSFALDFCHPLYIAVLFPSSHT